MVKRLGTIVGSYYACFAHNYKFTILFQRISEPLDPLLKCCDHCIKCVQNYSTVCYPVRVYNLLCMIHSILRAVVGTHIYLPFSLHKHYNGFICVVSISNDN